MLVHHLLTRSADRRTDARYISHAGQWMSYANAASLAGSLAGTLRGELNASPGDRVALMWENSHEAATSLFGVLAAGCTAVPVNTFLAGDELAYVLNHSDAKIVLCSRRFAPRLADVASKLRTVRVIVTDAPVPGEKLAGIGRISWTDASSTTRLESAVVQEDDLALIVYTSGSTGSPKGVMLTHRNLVSNMHSIAKYLRLTPDDRVMMILPHFYIYGLSLLLTHTLVGGSVVMDDRFMYPNTVLQNMLESEVTGFSGVPSTFTILLSRSSVREMSFPTLRYVTEAGGAMPPSVQKQVADVFAPAQLYIMYGATEAAPRLSYLEPSELPRKWGSIGKAVPGVELFVADQDGRPLPAGEEGELVARGPNITPGYWRDAAGTAEVLRNGLYFTGDLAVADDEGFLFVTGRSKEIIKVKGFRVSPREIEEHLAALPGVAEAAVIGVPDEVLGEAPVAYVVPANGATITSDQLGTALQKQLSPYKIPVKWFFRDELPRNPSGKLDKKQLKHEHQRSAE